MIVTLIALLLLTSPLAPLLPQVVRRNLTGVDTKDKDFEPLAAVPTIFGEETHGGEDVAAFAVGERSPGIFGACLVLSSELICLLYSFPIYFV